MDGVLSDESKPKLLNKRLATQPFDNLKMGLSTVSSFPTHATTLAEMVGGEIAVGGYARQVVTGWAAAALTGDYKAYSTATPVTFLNTSGGDSPTIYSWFYWDVADDKLVMAGRFATPFVLSALTGSYTTVPFLTNTGV